MKRITITKEDLLSHFNNDWKTLTPITKEIKLPYYTAKEFIKELITEGKLEFCQFGKLIKFRRKSSVTGEIPTEAPLP